MPDIIPESIYSSEVPGKGKGLFTSKAVEPGKLVFRIDEPLVCVPDNEHLASVCYQCFVSDLTKSLKSCLGCDVKKTDKWHDTMMMSKAALEFSGVDKDLESVLDMTTRVIINSMTVSNAALDPLGTCLSVYAAQLNHSCDPNCVFIFSGRSLSVRSLGLIPAGGELTISYIDTTMSCRERQRTLKANYYFDCSCPYCNASLSCREHDIPEPLKAKMTADKISQLEKEGCRVSGLAVEAPLEKKTDLLKQAAALFRPHEDAYPLWRYPRSLINYYLELISIDLGHWLSALGYALKAYLYIEPVQYRLSWHPIRTVRTFVLLKIIVEAGYQSNEGPVSHLYKGALQQFGTDWPLVIAALAGEIDAAIPQGFGMESSFAAEFKSFRDNVSQHPKPGKEAWQKERVKLNQLAKELVG
ncbi:MAG: hypothetical protein Q9194_002292 [Teloschistes cf. exilis]